MKNNIIPKLVVLVLLLVVIMIVAVWRKTPSQLLIMTHKASTGTPKVSQFVVYSMAGINIWKLAHSGKIANLVVFDSQKGYSLFEMGSAGSGTLILLPTPTMADLKKLYEDEYWDYGKPDKVIRGKIELGKAERGLIIGSKYDDVVHKLGSAGDGPASKAALDYEFDRHKQIGWSYRATYDFDKKGRLKSRFMEVLVGEGLAG